MTRTKLRTSVSFFALTIAAIGTANAQSASTPTTSDIESVTVTGVRASVGGALTLKQNATQMQDSIVSEDIGKLPDSTVVEALQHVTGISIIRNNVEPSSVLIRGLPDIATLLNGREIFSTTGRFVSLPDFPAELLARVDVHKTSSATDLEGGIAGLIDVRLHRPFDFDGLTVAGGGQAVDESHAGHVDPQGSLLVSDRWKTGLGDMGLLLDVSYKSIHNQEYDILTNQRTVSVAGVAGVTTGTPAAGLAAGVAAIPGTITFYNRAGLIERGSANASFQWKPADSVNLFAEYFYTRLRQKAPTDVNVFVDSVATDPALTTVYPGTNVAQNYASSGASITSLQDLRQKEDTQQMALGGDWSPLSVLTIKAEIDYTISNFQSTNYIPDDQYTVGKDGLNYNNDYLGTGGTRVTNISGNPQSNPAGEFIDQFYDQLNVRRGSEADARIDGEWDLSGSGVKDLFSSLEFGYRRANRGAQNRQPSNSGLNCNANQQTPNGSLSYNQYIIAKMTSPACVAYNAALVGGTAPTAVGGIPLTALPGGTGYHAIHGSFWGGKYGISSWTNVDPEYLVSNINAFRAEYGYTGPQAFVPTNTFNVKEDSDAGYGKLNYGFTAFDLPIDGNFGLRYIVTTLTEGAYTQTYVPINPAVSSTTAPNSTCTTCVQYVATQAVKTSYDLLPSFNMRFKLTDTFFARIGASKTETRPTFAQLNPGLNLSAPTATLLTGTASSGNPNLQPEKSRNYDADLEYYWGTANHISGAIFQRDIQGYIQNVATQISIANTPYTLTAPANLVNSTIRGAEMGYSQFLDFLPGFWSGFGWDINGTYVDGIFNNLSKWGINASGIYEQGPYSARFSYTWRSSYQANTTFTPGVQSGNTIASPRDNADFSFNYKWDDNITLTFDANNIWGSIYRTSAGRGPANATYYDQEIESFDRLYSLGIRYRL